MYVCANASSCTHCACNHVPWKQRDTIHVNVHTYSPTAGYWFHLLHGINVHEYVCTACIRALHTHDVCMYLDQHDSLLETVTIPGHDIVWVLFKITCKSTWLLLSRRLYVCMHACMHACRHVYMYVCMYVSRYMDVLPHIIMLYALSDQAPISLNVCTFCKCAHEHVAYLHGWISVHDVVCLVCETKWKPALARIYVCMYMCIYMHIYICICAYICMYTCICICK
jgi:hypothetical protein